jgi:hypothetical protein
VARYRRTWPLVWVAEGLDTLGVVASCLCLTQASECRVPEVGLRISVLGANLARFFDSRNHQPPTSPTPETLDPGGSEEKVTFLVRAHPQWALYIPGPSILDL